LSLSSVTSWVSRLRAVWSRYFFSKAEHATLSALKAGFATATPQNAGEPYFVLIEGFLASRFISMYYSLLLLLVQRNVGRRVAVILLTAKPRARYYAASRIYGFFFPVTMVNPEEFLDENDRAHVRSEAAALKKTVSTPGDLFALCYKGIHIGRDVSYAYIRNKLIGTVDAINSEVMQVLEQAVQNYVIADKVINRWKPEFLLITDNCYELFAPYFYGCLLRKIPVGLTVCFASGTGKVGGRLYTSLADVQGVVRRYTFSFDENTWATLQQSYGPESDAVVEKYLQMRFSGNDLTYNGYYHRDTNRLAGPQLEQALGLAEGDGRKKILIAAHLLWDDPGYEGLYPDYEIWIKDTLQIIRSNANVIWILKAHPSEKHMGAVKTVEHVVRDVFGDAVPEHIRFLPGDTHINTYSLIDFVDAVVTVRGTIGYEAACKGKPVVTAGHGPYSGLGFATEFATQDEYRHHLLHIHQLPSGITSKQIRSARMGLYGYFVLKTPVSPVLLRGEDVAAYASLGLDELLADPTLNSFAHRLISKTRGDFLSSTC